MLAEQGRNCIRCARLMWLSLDLKARLSTRLGTVRRVYAFGHGALLLLTTGCFADEVPLRFAITDGWAMPMVQIERGRPTQGILPDIMTSLATRVGMPAQFHVLARARLDSAMEHGEIDMRCYVSPDWVKNKGPDHLWSVPLFFSATCSSARPAPA